MAENPYQALSGQLSARFSAVKNRSKEYLRESFVFDPSIRRKVDPTAVATSDQPITTRGLPVQKDYILLQLKPTAAPNAVDQLLDKYRLTVQSGVPEIGLLVVKIGDDTPAMVTARAAATSGGERPTTAINLKALRNTIASLREETIVREAAVNTLLDRKSVPQSTDGEGHYRDGTLHFWDWREGTGTPAANDRDGNWGQKFVDFPQAWNFENAILARGDNAVHVGVLDVGFNQHEDLQFVVSPVTPLQVDDHGNHVAGIIAADGTNDSGVNGGTPFARLTVCSAEVLGGATEIPGIFPVLSDVIASLVQFMRGTDDVRVINISLGYNWVPNYGRNPNTDLQIKELVRSHGTIVRAIADIAADKGIILVCAAGNDSSPPTFPNIEAQFSSPFNWAGLNAGLSDAPAENIIVVEAIDRGGVIARFSNIHGCISAPGVKILSTVAFDSFGAPASDAYAAYNGTSMAAPQVTALIALMYAYNPDLTIDDVVEILGVQNANRPASVTPAPVINAFEALVACRDRSLKDLADLNNDDSVNMADFTIFRDALRQVEGAAGVTPTDLNGDGVIVPSPQAPANAPPESVYPRADLNGSGKLSRDPVDVRKVKGKDLSDLGVMMEAWEDSNVPAADLPGRL
jgi:subtilisin family serine protease